VPAAAAAAVAAAAAAGRPAAAAAARSAHSPPRAVAAAGSATAAALPLALLQHLQALLLLLLLLVLVLVLLVLLVLVLVGLLLLLLLLALRRACSARRCRAPLAPARHHHAPRHAVARRVPARGKGKGHGLPRKVRQQNAVQRAALLGQQRPQVSHDWRGLAVGARSVWREQRRGGHGQVGGGQ
jgi:hypothetical protein